MTVTFCFTPEHLGIEPHHTSPPREPEQFAEFCAAMIERYAPARRCRVRPAARRRPIASTAARTEEPSCWMPRSAKPSRNSVNVALVGVGNCASSLVQGIALYSQRRRERADRPDALGPRRLSPARPARRRRLGHRPAQGRPRRRRGDLRQAQLHRGLLRSRADDRRDRADGPTARRRLAAHGRPPRRPHLPAGRRARAREGRDRRRAARDRGRRAGQLPARRQPEGDRVLCRVRAGGRRRLRQQHPRLHRQRSGLGRPVPRARACRSSATTSRPSSARPSCIAC